MKQPRYILALDIGGTKLVAGMADLTTWQVLASARAETPAHLGGPAVYEGAVALCRQLPGLADVEAIGVCYGGQVAGNRVLRSNQVTGWEDFPLAQRLQADIAPLPVRIHNDANAIAWLEWQNRQRAGAAPDSLFYITVSTGIGGGLVLNGRIHEGRHGLSAEIGHISLSAEGPDCVCGRRGCLEVLAAGPAISRDYAIHTQRVATAREIAQRAGADDASAQQVLFASGTHVGRALAIMNSLLDVDVVVLGGGVSRAGDLWWQALRTRLHADTPGWATPPRLEASTFGELEGVMAAATLWVEQ